MNRMLRAAPAWILGLLLAAPGGWAQDGEMSVACKAPSAKVKTPKLRLEGAAPFPENVVLNVGLSRGSEDYGMGRIVQSFTGVGGAPVEVKGRKFVYEPAVEGPGPYSVQVTFLDEFQRPAILQQLKGKVVTRAWKFDFLAWTDDLIPQLGPKLEDIAVLQKECADMLRRFEDATASETNWKVHEKDLNAVNAKLLRKLEASDARAFYPAALNQIFYTIRSVQGTAPYFHFEAGKFAGGRSYHADNQEIKSHRGEPYTWPVLKRYVEESLPLAGRELALWLLKDIKRAGAVRPEIAEQCKKYAQHPGFAPFAERLQTAAPADLESMEKDMRAAPLLEPAPGDPKKDAKTEPKKAGAGK